jgi:protein-S-isoprenylcysteine O-methyltransferase Ste14
MGKMSNLRVRRGLHPALRYVVQRMTLVLVFAAILFVAAGKLAWLRGWVYVLYGLLLEAATLLVLARKAPKTLNQRGVWQDGVKPYDKIFALAWVILVFVTPAVAGLDERARLSPAPMTTLFAGVLLLTLSSAFGAWAMVENEHFEQFVRIQAERAHRVVTSGPYRIVRHPGYLGAIVGGLSVPLILGSWWTYAPVGGNALLFIIRTALEDRTLRKELEGYEAYTRETRYRLFPGIW